MRPAARGAVGTHRLFPPERRTADSTGRGVLLAGALAALLSCGAAADLVGDTRIRDAVAGKSDAELIAANPALERLGRERPDALEAILARLRAPVPEHSYRRDLGQEAVPETESTALAENPDLAELYRESPEAALDLLRLIREAAKERQR